MNTKKKAAEKAEPVIGSLETPEHGRGKLWRGPSPNNKPGTGRPRLQIKADFRALADEYGKKVLTDVMTDEDARHSDKIRATEVSARIGGLQEPVAYDREVVDLLAAVTSEVLRGHCIEEVDALLAKLSEAWMLGLGRYIRGD